MILDFDWVRFLEEHGIEYKSGGASTKAGNVYIECPYCADPGGEKYMGLSVDSSSWGCWKRDTCGGRGKSPVRLIAKLLGCSTDAAALKCGWRVPEKDDLQKAFDAAMAVMDRKVRVTTKLPELPEYEYDFPFEPLDSSDRSHRKPFRYLASKRDMDPKIVEQLGLGYCPLSKCGSDYMERRMGDRIILPISEISGRVVGVQGRALGNHTIRYDTRPGDLTSAVFNAGRAAEGGDLLVIVEGPFDALVLEHAALEYDIRAHAVALMGLSFSKKMARLQRLAKRFKHTVVCLDKGEEFSTSLKLQEESPFGCRVVPPPDGAKDAGELHSKRAALFLKRLAS